MIVISHSRWTSTLAGTVIQLPKTGRRICLYDWEKWNPDRNVNLVFHILPYCWWKKSLHHLGCLNHALPDVFLLLPDQFVFNHVLLSFGWLYFHMWHSLHPWKLKWTSLEDDSLFWKGWCSGPKVVFGSLHFPCLFLHVVFGENATPILNDGVQRWTPKIKLHFGNRSVKILYVDKCFCIVFCTVDR